MNGFKSPFLRSERRTGRRLRRVIVCERRMGRWRIKENDEREAFSKRTSLRAHLRVQVICEKALIRLPSLQACFINRGMGSHRLRYHFPEGDRLAMKACTEESQSDRLVYDRLHTLHKSLFREVRMGFYFEYLKGMPLAMPYQ